MMNYRLVLIIFSCYILDARGQSFNKISFTDEVPVFNNKTFNYYGITKGANDIELPKIENYTVFTVFKSSQESEELIWQIKGKNKDLPDVLTNKRFASISNFKFLNFIDLIPDGEVKLTTVLFNNPNLYQNRLLINKKIEGYNAPILFNEPLISEVIVTNREISSVERNEIESYLSIKYGITLEHDYITSNGEIIWDYNKNLKHSRNIGGIVRDNYFQLNQKQSKSSNYTSKFALEIGVDTIHPFNHLNNAYIDDGVYILWGEDGKEKSFSENREGDMGQLASEWKIITHPSMSENLFHLKVTLENIEDNMNYYLAIDRSGTSNYNIEYTDYLTLNMVENNKLEAYNIKWDSDHSGSDVFTIIEADPLYLLTETVKGDCNSQSTGILKIRTLGGNPPYSYQIWNDTNDNIISFFSNELSERNLNPGRYNVRVTDKNSDTAYKMIFIQGFDLPTLQINENYILEEGSQIFLDATTKNIRGLYYEWNTPYGILYSPKIQINKPGQYSLLIKNGDCLFRKDIEIKQIKNTNFEFIRLYPNPTDGYFNLTVSQSIADKLKVRIYSEQGKVINSSRFDIKPDLKITGQIIHPGVYFIEISNSFGLETKKLIVH